MLNIEFWFWFWCAVVWCGVSVLFGLFIARVLGFNDLERDFEDELSTGPR